MRYFISFISVFVSSIIQAATISGTLAPTDPTTQLTLIKMDYDTRNDSIIQKINVHSGKTFKITLFIKEPALYSFLNSKNVNLVTIVLKPDDNIFLKFESGTITSTGSPETQYLIDYESYRKKVYATLVKPVYDSLAAAAKTANKEKLEYWNKQQSHAIEQYKNDLGNWVKQPYFIESLAAIHHSLRWNPDNDIALMDTMLTAYKKKYPGTRLQKQLENKVNKTKLIALGATAPNFQSKNANDQLFRLSDVKAKYILVDFWASWCSPCRQESPTLVRLYTQYKDLGFSIVSVSVDDDKAKWIKAIEKDQYTWINVSELKGWNSPTAVLYSVSSIPLNFLLDSEGRIIAKNLRGTELESKLKAVFSK